MKTCWCVLAAFISLGLLAVPVMGAQVEAPLARVEASSGDVSVSGGEPGLWVSCEAGMPLSVDQVLKTGPQGSATVNFLQEKLVAKVPENVEIRIEDLLLKARLERLKGTIQRPAADVGKTDMQVTPLTGVRGTDEAESKAEEPKREHYWQGDEEQQ